jgi:hypothetical protein
MSENSTSVANGLLGFEVIQPFDGATRVVVGVVEPTAPPGSYGEIHVHLCDPETGKIGKPVPLSDVTVSPKSLKLVRTVGKLHEWAAKMASQQLGL